MRNTLLAGALVAVAALVVTGVVLSNRTDDVATIDGHAVTRDELIFHMRRLAPTVENESRDAKTVRLADRALDEICRDKTTFILAKEQGLVDSVDYEDFLADVANENDSRVKAIAAGEPVYGVAEFSPEEYYTHQLTEITTSLKERLSTKAGDPLWVTDADVRHAFDTDRDAWSANATTYTYSTLVVPVASPDGAAGLQQRVTAAGRLADVAAQEPGAQLTTGAYDGGGPNTMNAHTQDLMAVLGTLAPGQISAPVPGTGQVTYYQLDGKTVDENAAFADYSRRIRQSLIDEKFSQYLQRRVDHSDIEVDTAAVDAINPEDVQR